MPILLLARFYFFIGHKIEKNTATSSVLFLPNLDHIFFVFIKLIMYAIFHCGRTSASRKLFSPSFVSILLSLSLYQFLFLIFHKSSLTNPLYSNFHDLTEGVSMRRGIPGLSDEKRRRRREESAERRPYPGSHTGSDSDRDWIWIITM